MATYRILELDTLGGDSSEALGINDNSQVAGSADRPLVGFEACLWQGATEPIGLGTAWNGDPSLNFSVAKAINHNGKAVGWTQKPGSGLFHATLYDGGPQDLTSVIGTPYSRAMDINKDNVIVGARGD